MPVPFFPELRSVALEDERAVVRDNIERAGTVERVVAGAEKPGGHAGNNYSRF
jgi:hypothetical protein